MTGGKGEYPRYPQQPRTTEEQLAKATAHLTKMKIKYRQLRRFLESKGVPSAYFEEWNKQFNQNFYRDHVLITTSEPQDENLNHNFCKKWAEEKDVELVLIDGGDNAVKGIAVDGVDAPKVVYSKRKFLEQLKSKGMTEEEAVEWYEYNTIRSLPYMGENAPIFIEN